MTSTWNGYPPNPGKHGLYVIASKLGRNPTVYKWHSEYGYYTDMNAEVAVLPEEMSGLTYIGEVV